jgi:alpha-L-fucosidase 2
MLLLCALAASPANDLTLWYTRPASEWNEALPVGNGRLGAMVFGGVEEDCIQINDDTPRRPLADLLLTFSHNGEISDYARSLDARRAVAAVSYKCGNTVYTREIFSTTADGVVVVRLETDIEGALSFDAALSSPHMHSVNCPRSNHLILEGEMEGPSLEFEVWLVVRAEGGNVKSGGGKVSVERADAATLIIAAGIGDDPNSICRRTTHSAVRKIYRQLLDDHLRTGASSIDPD